MEVFRKHDVVVNFESLFNLEEGIDHYFRKDHKTKDNIYIVYQLKLNYRVFGIFLLKIFNNESI